MIKYINPNITEDNLKDYFDRIYIAADGNCAIHSIIYAIQTYTTLTMYNEYKPKKQDGILYYDTELTNLFRKDISDLYGEKIREAKSETIKQIYTTRQQEILTDGEWLTSEDIQFYG